MKAGNFKNPANFGHLQEPIFSKYGDFKKHFLKICRLWRMFLAQNYFVRRVALNFFKCFLMFKMGKNLAVNYNECYLTSTKCKQSLACKNNLTLWGCLCACLLVHVMCPL
jgi:hypothetical protein